MRILCWNKLHLKNDQENNRKNVLLKLFNTYIDKYTLKSWFSFASEQDKQVKLTVQTSFMVLMEEKLIPLSPGELTKRSVIAFV